VVAVPLGTRPGGSGHRTVVCASEFADRSQRTERVLAPQHPVPGGAPCSANRRRSCARRGVRTGQRPTGRAL